MSLLWWGPTSKDSRSLITDVRPVIASSGGTENGVVWTTDDTRVGRDSVGKP